MIKMETTFQRTSTSTYIPPQAALTTIFTPPASCGSWIDASSWLVESTLSSCFPGEPSIAGGMGKVYYSPGICPYGYSVDCTATEDTYFGTPILEGETAMLCCPSSFSCVLDVTNGCVSGPRSLRKTAMSLEIRWKESDLTKFETQPLPTGPLSSRRHGGWDPESSITYVYTFESNCSSLQHVFLTGSLSNCAPFTGDYYSPAICPSGWTAAMSRPLLSGGGPPVEADETAMLCCPEGMTTLAVSAYGCGPRQCISTRASFSEGDDSETALSLDLWAVRTAIQIRWRDSDLSIFETHPLTPGAVPTERLPGKANYTGLIKPLEPKYGAAIGLSFFPILFTCALIVFGLGLRKRRENDLLEQQQSPPLRSYQPAVLRWSVLTLIMGIGVTFIVLLELSCQVLPARDGPWGELEYLRVTKVFVTDITWLAGNQGQNPSLSASTTATRFSTETPIDFTCEFVGSFSVTTLKTVNRGTSTVVLQTFGSPTALCSHSATPIILPTCVPGQEHAGKQSPTMAPPAPGAPQGGQWLEAAQEAGTLFSPYGLNVSALKFHSQYFLCAILPTLLAVLLALPFKLIHLHAASLEGFRRAAGSSSTTTGMAGKQPLKRETLGTSLLGDWTDDLIYLNPANWGLGNKASGSGAFAGTPFLTALLVYLTAMITPLASEAWEIGLFGKCAADESRGCVPVFIAATQVVRALEVVLALVVLLTIILVIIILGGWSIGTVADPRSILGLATLAHQRRLIEVFGSLGREVQEELDLKEIRRRIGGLKVGLGLFAVPNSEPGHTEFGFMVESQEPSPLAPNGQSCDDSRYTYYDNHGGNYGLVGVGSTASPSTRLRVGTVVTQLLGFMVLLAALVIIIIYYRLRGEDTAFERFMSSQGFGPRFLFTLFGVVGSLTWAAIHRAAVILTPIFLLSRRKPTSASSSFVLPYVADPYSALLRLQGGIVLSSVSLATVLSDFLPMLLANIPFNRTRTFAAHVACSWLSIVIIFYMLLVLVMLVAVLLALRDSIPFTNLKLLRSSPVTALLVILSSSSAEARSYFYGLSLLEGKERDRRVKGWGLKYRLVRVPDGSGGVVPVLDVIPPAVR